jgi:hypothetical protein
VKILSRLVWRVLDWLDYRIWDVRLRMADAIYGPNRRRRPTASATAKSDGVDADAGAAGTD